MGMQADMEIQRAAKFHQRQSRRSGGTGARSALNNGLVASSRRCSAVRLRFTVQVQAACDNGAKINFSPSQIKRYVAARRVRLQYLEIFQCKTHRKMGIILSHNGLQPFS